MNKQELQIGNITYRPCCTDKVVEIRSNGIIGCDNARGLIPFSEIEPIPITKEFLYKNGFIRVLDKLDGYITFYDKEVDGHFLEIRFGISNTSKEHVVCQVDNSDRCFIGCVDIQYIHQLQNFLSILNIKMKVEL